MHIRIILSIFLALFAAVAAVAGDNGPFVTAEGRLVGAYQDDLDEAFVFLVLERDNGFTYACIMTNDTASVLRELQPLVGRTIAVSGHENTPTIVNRAVTKRQILEHTINGLSADQIAKRMNLSSFTVNEHLDAVKRKLGATNRTEAVAIALKKQILKI